MSYKLINDVIHGNIEFSDFESTLLRHTLINRLHKILQDSTAFMVYPCNNTSRFEHSLGVMHCASELLINSVLNADPDVAIGYLEKVHEWVMERVSDAAESKKFLNMITQITQGKFPDRVLAALRTRFDNQLLNSDELLKQLFEDKVFLEQVHNIMGREFCYRHIVCLFRGVYCETQSPHYKQSFLLVLQSLRIYAFLHDVGHLPFSHMFESALGSLLFSEEFDATNANSKLVSQICENYETALHESIGQRIIHFVMEEAIRNNVVQYSRTDDPKYIRNAHTLYIIKLITQTIVSEKNHPLFGAMHKIVDGSIDADRIDFSIRQLYNSGLNHGSCNISRIIKLFKLVKKENSESYDVCPSIQSINDIEGILKDRFYLYKTIVNHHAVRRTDLILQTAIEKTILLKGEEKKSGGSNEFYVRTMADVLSTIVAILKTSDDDYQGQTSCMYKYSQINDHWLMSKLNEIFIGQFLAIENELGDQKSLYNLLGELFHNARVFKSLWKRYDDYNSFVYKLGLFLMRPDNDNNVMNAIEEEISTNNIVHYSRESEQDLATLIGNHAINLMLDVTGDKCDNYRVITKMLNDNEDYYLMVPAKLKPGIKDIRVYYKQGTVKFEDFGQVSDLTKALEEEVNRYIKFFVYYYDNTESKQCLTKEDRVDKVILSIGSFLSMKFAKNRGINDSTAKD